MVGVVDEVGVEIVPRALFEELGDLLLAHSLVGQFVKVDGLPVGSLQQFVVEEGEDLFVEGEGEQVEYLQYLVQEGEVEGITFLCSFVGLSQSVVDGWRDLLIADEVQLQTCQFLNIARVTCKIRVLRLPKFYSGR
jgi:hypothetical protein